MRAGLRTMATTKRSPGWRAPIFELTLLVGGFVGAMLFTGADSQPPARPRARSREERQVRERLTLALGCAGGLVTFAGTTFALRAWFADGGPKHEAAARSLEFVVWEALSSFMIVICVVLCVWSARGLKGQWRKVGRSVRLPLVLYVVLAAAVLVFLWLGLPKFS